MKTLLLTGGTIISDGRRFENPGVLIRDGKIASLGRASADDAVRIELGEQILIPGLIDIHTHGAVGHDFTEGTDEAFDAVSRYQARHGVTGVVATLLTMPLGEMVRCARYMDARAQRAWPGASILGLHLEGPFLSAKNKGAHSARDILAPDAANYEPLLPYAGAIRSMTVSPESDAAAQMIARFHARGVVLSGGHDDGSEPYIEKAVSAGMSHTTHLFCVMSTMARRNGRKYLGLTEMALLDDRLTTEVIADTFHTDAAMVRLAYKCKGADGMCLVSDMLSVGGLPAGEAEYTLTVPGVEGGLRVVVDQGVALLADRTLNAGSITPLDRMIKITAGYGIPIEDVVRMASETPARVVHAARKGSVRAGFDADLCVLSAAYDVQKTIVGGRVVYEAHANL